MGGEEEEEEEEPRTSVTEEGRGEEEGEEEGEERVEVSVERRLSSSWKGEAERTDGIPDSSSRFEKGVIGDRMEGKVVRGMQCEKETLSHW